MRAIYLVTALLLTACPGADEEAAACTCDDECGDQVCVDGSCVDGTVGTVCDPVDATGEDAQVDANGADTEPADVDDAAMIDVREGFCTCNDDCLALGDGSVCNGTVCTFGVEGVPCVETDATTGDTTTDSDAADVLDTVDHDTSDVGTTDTVESDTAQQSYVDVVYDVSGGFSGMGARDITVSSYAITIDEPFGTDCRGTLDDGQMSALVAAAAAIDWDGVEASYREPENPFCCCDQFIYSLSIAPGIGGVPLVAKPTDWCDETTGAIPPSIATFVGTLSGIADEVIAAGCAP